ncbi:hypothetical protein MMC17_008390 [Xylographa soralifera]|nr:hypothetical protein [Xylographa soralifera]
MGELSDFAVGQTVELQDGRTAIVRFLGNPHFASGDWIAVELNDASGKNDGSVQGQRYFDCKPGHGMFVRPGVAAPVDEPTPRPTKKVEGNLNGAANKPRHSMAYVGGQKRQSVFDLTARERQSINGGSPTPSASSAASARMLRSPSKSPVKQLSSRPSSGHVTPRDIPPSGLMKSNPLGSVSRTTVRARPSMGVPTVARPPRQSIAGAVNGAIKPSLGNLRRPVNRLSTLQQGQARSSSLSGGSQTSGGSGGSGHESHEEAGREELAPSGSEPHEVQSLKALSPALSRTSATSQGTASPDTISSRLDPSSAEVRRPVGSSVVTSTTLSREVEDLKTKLRMMEKKRSEDREKLKSLDKIQGERDKFEGIIQKLQAKYQPQQQEIATLKRQIKEAEAKAEASETQQIDVDSAMEMATLDREMAEETAEAVRNELESLRQKHEELELEIEILREENLELGKDMSPEERTSQGWMQMERSNERLREALMRLRDVTQEQETELKQQIKEMEADMKEFALVRNQYGDTQERLAQSEVTIEDLRQQLETALGAEEMIEELTEKNLILNDQLDELKGAVEDLESLKELNDELELNHMETEKQLQDEIDYKETLVQEQVRKSALQDEALGDLEYTITRFRDLVINLQSDLEDMRASQQITETEANELGSRSKAMLDLNMRLQVSVTKAQVKTIDLELGRMEARESAEHLAIVQLFLPDAFANDREAVNTLLRFRRIGFKSSLIHRFVKEQVSSHTFTGHEDDMFAYLDVLDKLMWISTMCDRFVQFIQSCSLESFHRLGNVSFDLDPVERGLNGWIDGLKRDELKGRQCAAELQRSISLMAHLAEVHITDGLSEHVEDIRMRAFLMQSNLENAATALSIVRAMAQSKAPAHNQGDQEDEDVEDETMQHLFGRLDTLIAQNRSAKVVSIKAIHQLRELQSRSLTLDPTMLPIIQQSQSSIAELVSVSQKSGLALFNIINEEGRTSPFSCDELVNAIDPGSTSPFSNLSSILNTTAIQIQSFYNLTTTLSHCIEFPPPTSPPWELLSQNLRAASTTSASHEKTVERLKGELFDKNTALTMKDKILEELSVNVEVLEKRVKESSGRREKLRQLESVVESSASKEKELAKKLSRLERDLQALQAERDAREHQADYAKAHLGSREPRGPIESMSIEALESVAQLQAEIEMLQSTIRHLRLSSHEKSIKSSHEFLARPLVSKSRPIAHTHLALEAQDMLKSMLSLITRPENQMIQMKTVNQSDRLGWRPVRQTMKWQIGRQREEWEGWGEWRDDVAKRGREINGEERRKKMAHKQSMEVIAKPDFWIPSPDQKVVGETREVWIVSPSDWEDVGTSLGVT